MKYLIVQDWPSTSGNHAGMLHMCKLLVKKFPDKYKMFVKGFGGFGHNPFSGLLGKVTWWIYVHPRQLYVSNFLYPREYKKLCKPMFEQLKKGDEVFLLEYLCDWTPQYQLACYIRKHFPDVKIYALSHLTQKAYDSLCEQHPGIVEKWSKPIDKMLTLGSSLSTYFAQSGVAEAHISTGFHYVDTEYYNKQTPVAPHRPITVITMGMLQRNYFMVAEVVKRCPNVHWVICRGKANVDELFSSIPNVELKGFLAEDELRRQMDMADVSLNIMEDTVGSNVITTSMAMGLAMVCSDVGSIRDYCDETNALFCDNNVDVFVEAINQLVQDPERVEAMKSASLQKSKRLTIENVDKWFSSLK